MTTFPISLFLYLNICLIIFPLITSQLDDPSLSKLLACMSVIHQNSKSEEPDPNVYSLMMLKCFVTISDSQAHSFLMGLETGQNSLSKSEIKKLLDYESLNSMSQNELKQKSIELEKTLKKFKKMQDEVMGGRDPSEEGGDYDDDYDYDDEYTGERPSSINFFSLIPKGLYGIIGVFSSYISLFIVFVLVYFFLLAIRKLNDPEKKIKKKKKKNIEENEYEEEEYVENNINNKKSNKNSKNGNNKKKDLKDD